MGQVSRDAVAGDVFRLIGKANAAWTVLHRACAEAQVRISAMSQIKLAHSPEGQVLLLIVGLTEEEHRAIGDQVAEVVHPLRVALDRVARRKREFAFPASAWPRTEPIWETIKKLDNHFKHEDTIDLLPTVETATTMVYTADRTQHLGTLDAFTPVLESRQANVAIFRVAQRIPDAYRGTHVAYAVRSHMELRFAPDVEPLRGRSIADLCHEMILTAAELLRVLNPEESHTD